MESTCRGEEQRRQTLSSFAPRGKTSFPLPVRLGSRELFEKLEWKDGLAYCQTELVRGMSLSLFVRGTAPSGPRFSNPTSV